MPDLTDLLNTVHHADCFDLLARIPDGTIDAVIIDPPYGFGLDTWDKPIADLPRLMREFHRVMTADSFFAFTNQMPYMLAWCNAAGETFKYREHVSWVKRKFTNAATPLCRAHESIFIYSKGSPAFVETKGKWEDVKLPGYAFALLTIDAVDRYIKDLRLKAKGFTPSISRKNKTVGHSAYHYMRGVDGDRSTENANFTNVWSFLPGGSSVLDLAISEHATMKPLKMFERLVCLLSQPDAIVLDCFLGSGTTAVACRNTGRRFIAGDSDATYCAIARDRLRNPFEPREHVKESAPLSDLPLFVAIGD